MKTVNELSAEISTNKFEAERLDADFKKTKHTDIDKARRKHKSAVDKIFSRIEFLTTCLRYVETDPSKEFISKEVDRIESRINLIDDGYAYWRTINMLSAMEAERIKEYNKQMGLSTLKSQLQCLKFILNG